MTKVVVNRKHPWLSLSQAAGEALATRKGWGAVHMDAGARERVFSFDPRPDAIPLSLRDTILVDMIPRDDADLVLVVEFLGTGANGDAADLRVVTVPDAVEWHLVPMHGREDVILGTLLHIPD